MSSDLWTIDNLLTILSIAIVLLLVLFLIRIYVQNLLRSLTRLVNSNLKLLVFQLKKISNLIKIRNRELLIESGKIRITQQFENELHRINTIIKRDLSHFPNIQLQIHELIDQIERDYQQTIEQPTNNPDWVAAVTAIADLEATHLNKPAISKILKELNRTIQIQFEHSSLAVKESNSKRYQILNRITPYWRKLSKVSEETNKTLYLLMSHFNKIQLHLNKFDAIRNSEEKTLVTLHSSIMNQFIVSSLLFAIAIGGAFINFQLISLPLEDIILHGNDQSLLLGMSISKVAAWLIILIETAIGLFLLEALHVTHMFPAIAAMEDVLRRRFILLCMLVFILLLAAQGSLAFLRESMDQSSLIGFQNNLQAFDSLGVTIGGQIPLYIQLLLGITIPFSLAFIAIPFEMFINSGRIILAELIRQVVLLSIFTLKLAITIMRQLCEISIQLFDMILFLPISIDKKYRNRKKISATESNND